MPNITMQAAPAIRPERMFLRASLLCIDPRAVTARVLIILLDAHSCSRALSIRPRLIARRTSRPPAPPSRRRDARGQAGALQLDVRHHGAEQKRQVREREQVEAQS